MAREKLADLLAAANYPEGAPGVRDALLIAASRAESSGYPYAAAVAHTLADFFDATGGERPFTEWLAEEEAPSAVDAALAIADYWDQPNTSPGPVLRGLIADLRAAVERERRKEGE